MLESFTVSPDGRGRNLDMPLANFEAEYFGLQQLVAILLAKLGGTVEVTANDLMEIADRHPMVITWPPDFEMTQRWQLVDRFGAPWKADADV